MRVHLKSSHHKKIIAMVIDNNQTYCGDHFIIYTNIESLCCAPETNSICQLFLNKKVSLSFSQCLSLPVSYSVSLSLSHRIKFNSLARYNIHIFHNLALTYRLSRGWPCHFSLQIPTPSLITGTDKAKMLHSSGSLPSLTPAKVPGAMLP